MECVVWSGPSRRPHGKARQACPGIAWVSWLDGLAWQVRRVVSDAVRHHPVSPGWSRQAGHGCSAPGPFCQNKARFTRRGTAGNPWRGTTWCRESGLGLSGQAWQSLAWGVPTWQVSVGQVWPGVARQGTVGRDRQAGQGWRVFAHHGMGWHLMAGESWLLGASHGKAVLAWHELSDQGTAWQGRQGKHGSSGRNAARQAWHRMWWSTWARQMRSVEAGQGRLGNLGKGRLGAIGWAGYGRRG